MERDEFLAKFGMGLLAVCTGCVVGCGKSPGNDPAPSDNGNNPPVTNPPVTNPPANGNLITADLNGELTSVGSSKTGNGVILVRTGTGNAAGSFTAVQQACTHEGTSINYNNTQGIFICPNHGSQFSTSGSVIQGPAATALRKFTVTVTGTTLAVTA